MSWWTASDALDQEGFYGVLGRRRDVRAEFSGTPVEPATLQRILAAGHAAPSVGMSQPWDFVVVTDDEVRRRFEAHVREERDVFAATLEVEQLETFSRIKIDGILEASLSVVVTYDASRGAPNVLGRHAIADAGLYSVCLAIENLWLASTHEGWGLGWVSFYRESFLRELMAIPSSVRPIAWLCLGPVTSLQEVPDLERHGWRARSELETVLHFNRWGTSPETHEDARAAVLGGAVASNEPS